MWSGYSTRDAAQLAGLAESAVRSCARAGLLSGGAVDLPARLSFQDLAVLKAVKQLCVQGLSLRRVRRQLDALRRQLPEQGAGLSSVTLSSWRGQVVVREDGSWWQADSGQLVFDFDGTGRLVGAGGGGAAAVGTQPGGQIAAMPIRREAPAPEPAFGLTADQWFERAGELEEPDPEAAIESYQRALHLRPDSSETLINLGRLYAESGRLVPATDCFTRAVELDPNDSTALYNLGVVAQDLGKDSDAIELYQRALALDPTLAEAHYNLATIFDRSGDPRAAIRHIHEYRKLTRQ